MYRLGVVLCFSLVALVSSEENSLELNSTEKESENITENILDWKAPPHLKQQFPYYLSGVDYENRPVVVLEWGKWNPQKIAEENGEDLRNLKKYANQLMERMRTSFYKKALNDPEARDDLAVLIDFDGLDLKQARSPANVKFFIEMSEKLEKVFHQFEYGFVVNANPLVQQLLQIVKPFMANFLERTEVYGTNSKLFIPKILRKIPRDQLHPAYGGLKKFLPVAIYG